VYLYPEQVLTILNCCTFLLTLHFNPAWKRDSFLWINLYVKYRDILSGSDFKALYCRLKYSFTSEDFLTLFDYASQWAGAVVAATVQNG
jgi:hypothetical protein